jgi:hypothetical protein
VKRGVMLSNTEMNMTLRTILIFLLYLISASLLIVAVAFIYRGLDGYLLLNSGNVEIIDICRNNPPMDCNPAGWYRLLILGGLSLLLGASTIWGATNIRKSQRVKIR